MSQVSNAPDSGDVSVRDGKRRVPVVEAGSGA